MTKLHLKTKIETPISLALVCSSYQRILSVKRKNQSILIKMDGLERHFCFNYFKSISFWEFIQLISNNDYVQFVLFFIFWNKIIYIFWTKRKVISFSWVAENILFFISYIKVLGDEKKSLEYFWYWYISLLWFSLRY